MFQVLYFLVTNINMLILSNNVECGKTDLWDKCGCKWNEWEAWGDCSKECNGEHSRSRSVNLYTEEEGCPFSWRTCSSDGFWQYSRCNIFCYNGGTSDSYSCTCKIGFYGSCCEHQITCGNPGGISHGKLHGSVYTYGKEVSYSCNSGYKLIGKRRRQCEKYGTKGYWSARKPRCAYYTSCNSGPCKNGATCVNIPDTYVCTCATGWSGKQCTIDVQPPLMSGCPNDMDLNTSDMTLDVAWEMPNFWDPHGNKVDVSSNYPKLNWTFPWGDFTVSFLALKLLNGLKAECLLNIRIRPYPCDPLSAPINGAVVCNNWRTDFGRVCTSFCRANHTVPRGMHPNEWYVCVASGSWLPNAFVTKCSASVSKLPSTTGYNFGANFTSCKTDVVSMQAYYIKELKKSPFKFLCDKFADECDEKNVSVVCQ